MKDVNAHPYIPWNWKDLSYNPNITMKDVLVHLDKPWNWQLISCNYFLRSPMLIVQMINKLKMFRVKHGHKMYTSILLSHSEIYTDLSKSIVNYL